MVLPPTMIPMRMMLAQLLLEGQDRHNLHSLNRSRHQALAILAMLPQTMTLAHTMLIQLLLEIQYRHSLHSLKGSRHPALATLARNPRELQGHRALSRTAMVSAK